ncbi:MAG TPA: TIGR03620 family F420-dependent LLM class oxidoreductase [Candidatus Saccharimonadia bacterium]|nr:TIGR03620 family F420-dependent LLM class oxidoreductase [Candidatus Saccharimonadia bacterium]
MTQGVGGRAAAASLGRVGAWSFALQANPASVSQSAVSDLEAMGLGAVWIPESVGSKEAFSHAAVLLGAGERIVVATGIANIYARDPMAAANGALTLAEAYPGRFAFGLGVSHAPSVAARGGTYASPVATMRAYLDGMAAARYGGPEPSVPAPLLLAALGPKMLELSAERTDGALPYFVPVEHTAVARSILGPQPCLAVEMTAVLETDPTEARRIARAFARHYLSLPNYAGNLRRLGYADDDLTGEGSDRLIDAVIVWGDAAAIAERARQHFDAGADHVCIQLRAAASSDLGLSGYRELARILLR